MNIQKTIELLKYGNRPSKFYIRFMTRNKYDKISVENMAINFNKMIDKKDIAGYEGLIVFLEITKKFIIENNIDVNKFFYYNNRGVARIRLNSSKKIKSYVNYMNSSFIAYALEDN